VGGSKQRNEQTLGVVRTGIIDVTEVEVGEELEVDDEEEVDEEVLEEVEDVKDVLSVGGLLVLVEGDGVLVEAGFTVDPRGQWLKVKRRWCGTDHWWRL
jgi:hypothetical protein